MSINYGVDVIRSCAADRFFVTKLGELGELGLLDWYEQLGLLHPANARADQHKLRFVSLHLISHLFVICC